MAAMESMSSNRDDEEEGGGKDEWEVESAETGRCYTSNCECWVVSTNGGSERRERRSDAYPHPLERSQYLSFEPNHRFTPQVKFLGTFRSPPSVTGDQWFSCYWSKYLVIPNDDMMYIPPALPPPPSPATSTIPLFSLTRFIRVPPPVDENGVEGGAGANGVVGVSYSLPLHPPHSKLIPSQKHPLPITTALHADVQMIGSCNGLYCLLSGPVRNEASVIVWNPTTGLSRPLPPFRCSDHRLGSLIFGFGYDPATDDYKVVKMEADTRVVEVVSLYSNSNSNSVSWRSVQGLPQNICNIRRVRNGAVSFAGCLNWLAEPYAGATMVASFDLATESFRFHSVPVSFAQCCPSLCILDGYLSFVGLLPLSRGSGVSLCVCSERVLDIWIMREYGVESSWTNAASIAYPHSVEYHYRILHLSKDVLILAVQHSMVFVFNLKENTLVCPHIRGAIETGTGVEPYVQSQVSPLVR